MSHVDHEVTSDLDESSAPAKQVFFHVGAPKTGTTYLQQVMWHNRRRLASNGVCYPLDHPTAHFTASLDLCKRKWGGRWDPSWDGAWDRVAQRIQRWRGDRAIFSGEIMGLASPEQAALAVESVQPAEVHVVFTARDLARQLPSDWQEQVKHRHTVTLTKFVDDLIRLGHQAPRPFGELFWGLHDPAYVLKRWEDIVPVDRIHVVTVPQVSARTDLLWRRFATVTGLDPDVYDIDVPRDNTAMGVVETEFLRRFNERAGKALTHEHGPVINNLVGQRLLAGRPGKQPIRMPRQHDDWVTERSGLLIAQIRESGYHVVGDLDELLPSPPPRDEPVVVPEEIAEDEVESVAFDLVAGLIQEVLSLRGQVKNLTAEVGPRGPGGNKAGARKAAAKTAAGRAGGGRGAGGGGGAGAGAGAGAGGGAGGGGGAGPRGGGGRLGGTGRPGQGRPGRKRGPEAPAASATATATPPRQFDQPSDDEV